MKTVRFLFNDDMARAIVDGRKTVTRRPVTPNASQRWWLKSASQITACPSARMLGPACPSTAAFEHPGGGPFTCIDAPCAPGGILIGRECFAYIDPEHGGGFAYRADYDPPGNGDYGLPRKRGTTKEWYDGRWSPSIHMPDAAARIRRRVVSVTVERLQSITEEDAMREGIRRWTKDGSLCKYGHVEPGDIGFTPWVNMARSATDAFARLWDRIYGERCLGWSVNPWVWRIEFSAENVEGEK